MGGNGTMNVVGEGELGDFERSVEVIGEDRIGGTAGAFAGGDRGWRRCLG